MFVLNKEEYGKVRHLVTSDNELSVLSVLNGEMPGEVKVVWSGYFTAAAGRRHLLVSE